MFLAFALVAARSPSFALLLDARCYERLQVVRGGAQYATTSAAERPARAIGAAILAALALEGAV